METSKSVTTPPNIDSYKYSKERKIIRRLFTVSANHLEEIFKSGETKITELKCEYNKIDQLYNKLIDLNNKIKSEIYENTTDTNLEKEILSAEEYSSKYIMIKTKYEIIIDKNFKMNNSGETTKPNRYFKLPEIKFKKFNGEIKNWLTFWGQFKKIDQDPGLDDDDKFFYLMQNIETDTDVYSLVASYPPTGTSYVKCMEELKQRYAREELLIEVYVRELLALVLKENLNLIELYDKLNAHLRALDRLGHNKYHHAFILPLVESALPLEILKLWERHKGNIIQDKNPEEVLSNLMAFVKAEIESMQRVEISKQLAHDEKVATASCLLTQQNQGVTAHKVSCIWCDKDSHPSNDCYKMYNLTLEQRQDIVKKKKACAVCLRIGHYSKSCKAYVKCFICQKRHSTAICSGKEDGRKKTQAHPNSTTSLSSHNYGTQTLLQTVMINIRNGDKVLPVRALFDSGSQRSYICENLANKLKLVPTGQEKLNHCLFGNVTTKLESHNIYSVTLESLDSDFKMDIEALSQSAICGNIPKLNLNKKTCKILKRHKISLPDLKFDIKSIGILIGADYAGFMLTNNVVVMENGLVAIKTKLGWTIQDRQISTSCNNLTTSMFCMSVSTNNNLTDFWTLETLGIHDPVEIKSRLQGEAEAVSNFKRTVRTLPDGRYEVELPFKVGFDDLLSNYDRAKKRLDSNTKKLISSGKYQDYDVILQEWLRLGIIEKEPSDKHRSYNSGHYLPHRAVLKDSSLTSALRPVFDASCPDKNGLSLNACLEKGINYIEHIPKLLIGFRKGAIGITSDIAKAFLQISLKPEDREYLKFLWWENESLNKVVEYKHCRVVFGLTSSPFLLSATIIHHLNKITGKFKQTAQLLKNSFYVDNCITSLDTEEETRRFIQESKEIMKGAQFDLRMWTTSPLQINEAGTANWADLASRGCNAKQLLEYRWVEGPDFLRQSTAKWPRTSVNVGTADEAVAKKELKGQNRITSIINVSETENFSDRLLYYSKYSKIVRVVAWLTKFARKCLKNKINTVSKNITSDEYENAETKLFLLLQRENKDILESKYKNIHTFQDQEQLIRIKTKLLLSDMPENTKCPILLPAKSEIVRRLVEQKHIQLQHAGTNTLIAEIRKSYWIFGIRRLVRSVITSCMICKKYKVKQMQAPVAPLPVDRIKSSVPFEVTGVDLAGPLILKNGDKCWIVLFTCAVYRAVHLELALSLSTEAFLRTLRRFIARRGRIKIMYSDNGTNLVGSKNLIDSIDWDEVQQKTCIEKIKWKLNAPTGAWWGGFFERLIRSMKDLLRKILGKASVTYDELHTILCDCESIMNSRPLTYVQDDSADSLEPLTPACFLQPLPCSDTTDLDLLDSKSLNVRLKYLQKLRDDFRHRFRTEYLTELIQRGKEKGKFEELKEGQVVLIETEEKRIKWPLGVITKIYKGKDGVNRTALIKTAIGSKVRPIQRLYSLELSSGESDILPTSRIIENVEKGYWNNEAATKETVDSDGWLRLHTGDVAYYDDDHYFYIVDRTKELIKVSPTELESVIMELPEVADVAMVGVPDPLAGEVPKAFVVLKSKQKLTEKQVYDAVAQKLTKYKHLEGGVVFLDTIPRNAAGKIMRNEQKVLRSMR